MARTFEEILTAMDEAQAATSLPQPPPNSPSGASVFGYLKRMVAFFSMGIERQVDLHNTEVQAMLDAQEVGTLSWYCQVAKAFQLGDPLVVLPNGKLGYQVVDPAKQIVAQASASEEFVGGSFYRILMKVAATVSGGGLAPLAANDLAAFKLYIEQMKFAGVRIDLISLPAAQLRLNLTIEYDRQVLRADGSVIGELPARYPVRDAIQLYIRFLPFNSEFYWNALVDVLQKTEGVKDALITGAFYRDNNTQLWAPFTRKVLAKPGHMELSISESVITYV